MHGEIDLAPQQSGIELFGEESLPADLGQRPVEDAISARGDENRFAGNPLALKQFAYACSLHVGKPRAAAADPQGA